MLKYLQRELKEITSYPQRSQFLKIQQSNISIQASVGYETGYGQLCAVIYHSISNARTRNNCQMYCGVTSAKIADVQGNSFQEMKA